MTPADDGASPLRDWRGLAVVLAALSALVILDPIGDLAPDNSIADRVSDAVEWVLRVAIGLGALLQWRDFRARSAEWRDPRADLERARQDGARWRSAVRVHLAGLGAAIETQFHDWGFTPAEQEVGLLLLKGLSHREIAGLRHSSERTVRQQARAVYRKSSLPGRAALSAFFLEDVLLPLPSERASLEAMATSPASDPPDAPDPSRSGSVPS